MVRAWVAEEPDELPMSPEELLEETERRISLWNEQGRALCSAFLDLATRD
jgi:hypothetical protein